jgi:sulfite exporter TauE/SafE
MGAAVGYGVLRAADGLGRWVNITAGVAILAGVLLIIQGLLATGLLRLGISWLRSALTIQPRETNTNNPGLGCLVGGMVGSYLRDRRLSSVFLAGVLTGLLPCGLVYAFATLAASSGDPFAGAATMAAFGAGTVPMMILAGTGAQFFSLAGRQKLLTIAAWCVVITGALSIARGVSFLHIGNPSAVADCPFCKE